MQSANSGLIPYSTEQEAQTNRMQRILWRHK